MREMSTKRSWILDMMQEEGPDDWWSPTEIGRIAREDGLTRNTYGSPWASPKCLALVEMGYLERYEDPKGSGCIRHVFYRLTEKGREFDARVFAAAERERGE